MSLPTPPRTSHRGEKENKRPSTRMVVWKEEHEIHTLTAEGSRRPLTPFQTPTRSILKKTTHEALPYVEDLQREITPEPSDPLADLHYLDHPIAKIIAVDAALRDLIESYNVLAARLRACVVGNADVDASWPLFQPLRKHRDALVSAMCRDLGRALEMPLVEDDAEEVSKCLPSPEKSPKKKGMSAEGVKYARDLCTTCHSVLKLLSAVFTLPAIFGIFEDSQLGDLLTATLAIPLAPELPTPNARKTYALSIWLLQFQRLPADVLLPARDRIAYALRRGIEGELGKEGKKGSISDGLKAIHDLSICYPSIFVPAFTDLVPSIFAQLLAPTLPLRAQACHALGGYAYGLYTLPSSALHSRAANYTASYLTKAPLGTPSKKPTSPTKDSAIIRTMRTTLGATEPKHVAQGPVWSLSLLAYFIIMLGPQVYLDDRMSKCITALSALATRHPRSSIRSLACLVWRCMTWAYFRPIPVKLAFQDDEVLVGSQDVVQDSEAESEDEYTEEELRLFRRRMNQGWRVLSSVIDMGAAVSTIGALLSVSDSPPNSDRPLKWALSLLADLSKRGGSGCQEALFTVSRLLSRFDSCVVEDEDSEYDWSKLIPIGLFSSNPGLLTVDYGQLAPVVKGLIHECAHIEEVRPLVLEEATTTWVYDRLVQIWGEALRGVRIAWGEAFPQEIMDVWLYLLNVKVQAADGDESQLSEFASYVAELLVSIVEENGLDLSSKHEDDDRMLTLTSPLRSPHSESGHTLPGYRWKFALKLLLLRQLWLLIVNTLPPSSLATAAETLLSSVVKSEVNLVADVDVTDEVRDQWASLCAELAYHCDEQELNEFWSMKHRKNGARRKARPRIDSVRHFVWSHFLQRWREEQGSWETSAILLGAPFLDANAWEMADEDLEEWKAFLQYTVDRALDYGVDAISVVDHVASIITGQTLSASSSTRAIDLLLSCLDITDARSLPASIFEFANETLLNIYPPTLHNKAPSLWLLRTITRCIDACPVEIAEHVLEILQDGLCRWILDDKSTLTGDEYDMDVLPIYQTVLARLMVLSLQPSALTNLAQLVESGLTSRSDKSEGAISAFVEFWKFSYASKTEPEGGWPERIVHCLEVSGLRSAPSAIEIVDADDEEVENQLLLGDSDDVPLSPAIPFPSSLAAAFVPRSKSSASTIVPQVPETPCKTTRFPSIFTPQQTKKASSPVRLLPAPLFYAPPEAMLVSPQRSPTTPKRRTPGSVRLRAEKGDKENTSPLRGITSITERIASQSPIASILGKRRLDDVGEDELRETNKRPHRDVTLIFGDTLRNHSAIHVNMAQIPERLVTPTKPSAPTSPVSRKAKTVLQKASSKAANSPTDKVITKSSVYHKRRKGVFLDAVEVPTLREVLKRRSASLNLPNRNTDSVRPLLKADSLPAGGVTLRQTRSNAKLTNDGDETRGLTEFRKRGSAPPRPPQPPASRRKRIEVLTQEDVYSISSSLSSPLQRLKEMDAMGSDDSITLATPNLTVASSSMASSDDDPNRFLGQVTPQRLVSPAIRRVLDDLNDDPFAEPGSDDSNMSSSPSSERVARMKSRNPVAVTPLRRPFEFTHSPEF
ncbi:hypothetical protein BDY19DRAFT_907299 [Irpex rosettiformis]|uniref:Uncharacterized protein n=1 Tax=Irpex rosettiformis TaxID=378272 RepID=A0ACB8U0J6_9APHY|nr:hypothetical protein BDY19DRAFT_907299 [Irpex rosettiformis]